MGLRSKDMASERTIYWMAVAVLALFAGNHFANKYDGSCLADRAMATVQRLSGEATHFAARAQSMFSGESRFAAPELAMARVQGQFASMQAGIARQQAACARLEAQRARMMALEQIQHVRVRVACPRQSVRVEIPQSPAIVHDGTI
jgi:hypothetical protein